MSYELKVDEMVGYHLAEFQREISLAKQLKDHKSPPPISNGPAGGDRIPIKEGEAGAIRWLWQLLFGANGSTCAAQEG